MPDMMGCNEVTTVIGDGKGWAEFRYIFEPKQQANTDSEEEEEIGAEGSSESSEDVPVHMACSFSPDHFSWYSEYVKLLRGKNIKALCIPSGVRELPDDAFFDCSGPSFLTFALPVSVERFGVMAFTGSEVAPELEEINVPDSVRELDSLCFFGAKCLERVTFGEHSVLENLGTGVFWASHVAEIHIPDSLKVISAKCFYECHLLKRVTFGKQSALEYIGKLAFADSRIEEINIPDRCRELASKCFCLGVDHARVTFGLLSSLERIGTLAFREILIREVTIPDNVRELCRKCFMGCGDLSRVKFGANSLLERFGGKVFHFTKVAEINIPCRVHQLDRACFQTIHSLESLTFDSLSTDQRETLGEYRYFHGASLERIGFQAFSCTGIFEIVIPDTVKILGRECLLGCCNLSQVIFGRSSSLERIDSKAFAFCRSITEMVIPDGVRVLGNRVFYCCEALTEVKFGRSSLLEDIGSQCFAESNLAKFRIPSSVRSIRGAAFACSVESPDVVCCDNDHFRVCNSLLLSKDGRICYGCVGITSGAVIPDTVKELCDRCFCGCECITSITFGSPSCLERIGAKALLLTNIGQIAIPDSVKELCDRCFEGCDRLSEVKFGRESRLEKIGYQAFAASRIGQVVIPRRVKILGKRCFYECKSLTEVKFGRSSLLEDIGSQCFAESSLSKIRIPSSVRSIRGAAFVCSIESPDEMFCGNDHFCVCNNLLLSKDGRICYGSVARGDSFEIPDSVRELHDRCFFMCEKLRSIEFGASSRLERIGVKAFSRSGIEQIKIPDSVKEICDRCFEHCKSFWKIEFGQESSLEQIGFRAFSSSYLSWIKIPDRVQKLMPACFHQSNLSSVTLSPKSTLKFIGAMCFASLSLEDFDIPSSVTSIGPGAFSDFGTENYKDDICANNSHFCVCDHLLLGSMGTICYGSVNMVASVVVPDSVRELSDKCFFMCSTIFEMGFGDEPSLERIGEQCFAGSSLSMIWIPSSVTSIGGAVFAGCGLERLDEICDDDCHFCIRYGLLLSKDEKVCYSAIDYVSDVLIPDTVEEICDRCFYECSKLVCVRFGPSSALKRIGTDAFSGTCLDNVLVPDAVKRRCGDQFTNFGKKIDVVVAGASVKSKKKRCG